jgi:hypothetical protein
MKRLITESNEKFEIWKCMFCGYKETFKLYERSETNKEKTKE